MKRLIAIGICSLALSTQFSQAVIINSFEFDDATDTPFADASSTGSDPVTFGSFASSVFKTNGSGQVVWDGGGGGAFGIEESTTFSSPITSGIVYSRLDFDSWDLAAQVTSNSIMHFGFEYDNGTSDNRRFQHRFFIRDDLSNILLQTTQNNQQGGYIGWDTGTLSATETDPYSIILGIDIDNDLFSLWTDTGSGYVQKSGGTNGWRDTLEPIVSITNLNFEVDDFNSSSTVTVERWVIGDNLSEIQAIPEPTTFFLTMLGLGSFLLFRRNRKS